MSGIERLVLAAGLVILYALFCLWCALRHRRIKTPTSMADTLVAYASQSGSAMQLAHKTVEALRGRARLITLNQMDDQVLTAGRRALIVASTYGRGEPPDNGARFAQRYLNDHTLDLSHLEFAVLALGDSRYPDFCDFGRRVYQSFADRGATPLCQLIEMDAQCLATTGAAQMDWDRQLQRLGAVDRFDTVSHPPMGPYLPWRLQERVVLNEGSPGWPLFHLKFAALPGDDRQWQPGDLIEVVPPAWRDAGTSVVPRKYSIASISTDGTLDLIIRQQRDENGDLGLASGWLTAHIAVEDSVEFRLCGNPRFRSPAADTPLILIGNGSGFAGLRALLRHRQQHGGGRNWLVFGERKPDKDRIFADEIREWSRTGHLERLDLAFSRCVEQPMYVQDCLHFRRRELREWVRHGAVIMVCGSRVGMAQGVDAALEAILGREVLESLDRVGRYRRDIY